MLIGVTGQIGSGKSTAAEILKSFGAVVVDADLIGRQVVDGTLSLRRKLAHEFGEDIIDSSGILNRKKLADRAFRDEQSKRVLDVLVHPYLLEELDKQVRFLKKKYDVVVIDAALLLDWELDLKVDFVLVIHASQNDRIRRLEARGISRSDAKARQKAQLPFRVYQSRADRVVLNNKNIASLKVKLSHLWKCLVTKPVDSYSNQG
ncbi:MAG: dephospho-CoA kinase [Candidatus Zixiibacteriota bacterium]|nr:MAG: dephospho-CoA kinase [candidate division Zixibacteria bacterium]